MPTVFEIYGFCFFFYSNEGNEPVHISKDNATAKYWIEPDISEEYSYGFKVKDRKVIRKLVIERKVEITKKWNEHFR